MYNKIGREYSTNGENRNSYWVLVGKSEGKRLLGRLRRRWDDNIKIDLKSNRMWWYGVMVLAQNREQWRALVNMVMNFRVV
jgi:hypothetical protein